MASGAYAPDGSTRVSIDNSACYASATFTPAAASHTAGDSVGTAGTFAFTTSGGAAIPAGSNIRIVSGTLQVNGGTQETTAWRLHLFNVTPPSALADDAAFTLASGDRASYLGYVDFAQLVDLGDTLYIEANNIQKQFNLASTSSSLFGYLVNGTTLTPQAVAHIVKLQAVVV